MVDPSRSNLQFHLMVLELNHCRAPQDLKKHSHAFAGDALNQALNATECSVFQLHRLARFELAELLQRRLVAVLFEPADAVHERVVQHGGLEPEADDGGNPFGAAHSRDALLWLAGPEQDVAREHGLEQRQRALFGFFELFIKRQISLKSLLLEIDQCRLFLPRLGVSEVPAVIWRGVDTNGFWQWRILVHYFSMGLIAHFKRGV